MQDADLKVTVEAGPSLKRALSPILEEVERLKGRVRELELGAAVDAAITEFLDARDPGDDWTLNAAAGAWVEGFPQKAGGWLVTGPAMGVNVGIVYHGDRGNFVHVGGSRIGRLSGGITHYARIHPPETGGTDEES